jgi:hypothetical protein
MPQIHASTSAIIPAPPDIVYGLIADYRVGHPSILPGQYFRSLRVEAGGVGAGTRISFEMRAFGRLQRLRAQITEPIPGRQLLERYAETGMVTTFTVDPHGAGQQSRVTIATRYIKTGLAGWLERWLVPAFLRRVFRAELRALAAQAEAQVEALSTRSVPVYRGTIALHP